MFLFGMLILTAAQVHLLSAIGTVHHSCERIDHLRVLRSALVLAEFMHQVKGLLRNDRFLRILEDLSLVLRIVDDLMQFVGLHLCAEIDRMTTVFIAFKNMGNRLRSSMISLCIMPSVVTTLR